MVASKVVEGLDPARRVEGRDPVTRMERVREEDGGDVRGVRRGAWRKWAA
jgi:hypothetical protein